MRVMRQKTGLKNRKSSNDHDGLSSDEDSIDLSEKANRVEGAGGNDFHYFCRICKDKKYERLKDRAQIRIDKELDLRKFISRMRI